MSEKYALVIIKRTIDTFKVQDKTIIDITGDTFTEVLAKLPLSVEKYVEDIHFHNLGKVDDDDIPF